MFSPKQVFARKLTELIVKELHPEKVILFGSVALGEETEGSDIDLFIIQDTRESYPKRMRPVYRLARNLGYPYSLEPIVYTPLEFQKALNSGSAFLAEILAKGKILYEC